MKGVMEVGRAKCCGQRRDLAGMFKKLKEVHYSWGIPDSGESVRVGASLGMGKGLGILLMANGKPEGIKQGDVWSDMHIYQHYGKPTNLPRQAVLGSHGHDARDRNQVNTFGNNIPPQPHPGVPHDSINKLGETLVLPTQGNQHRKVANGHLHRF